MLRTIGDSFWDQHTRPLAHIKPPKLRNYGSHISSAHSRMCAMCVCLPIYEAFFFFTRTFIYIHLHLHILPQAAQSNIRSLLFSFVLAMEPYSLWRAIDRFSLFFYVTFLTSSSYLMNLKKKEETRVASQVSGRVVPSPGCSSNDDDAIWGYWNT